MGELAEVSEIDGRTIQNAADNSILMELKTEFINLVALGGEPLPF